MDWESPADAWYVWMAVALVSVVVAGVALAAPSGPPPDANEAANTIDGATGSTFQASGSYEHDADEAKITSKTIALRNEFGTDRASIAYGEMVPVIERESLENVIHGTSYEAQYDGSRIGDSSRRDGRTRPSYPAEFVFLEDIDDAYEEDRGQWHAADGELVVRTIRLDSRLLEILDSVGIVGVGDLQNEYPWLQYDDDQGEFYVTLVTV